MKVHELAKYFPILEGEEFDLLVQDIKEHGQLEPIVTVKGEILDGVNRYRACEQLGIEPITEEYQGDDALSYVISINIRRRHLTESQRAMLANEMLPEFAKQAKEHSLANLKYSGKDHERASPTVSRDTVGPPGRSTTKVGEIFGVSHGSVARAKRIKEQAPEKVDDIIKGKTTVGAVDIELRQAKAAERAAEQKEKGIEKEVKQHPKIVKDYFDLIKGFKAGISFAIEGAKRDLFSPETREFVKTKHEEIINLMYELEELL